MMLSNHYPVTFSNPRVIPAIVTCVIVAGALVRYFYNRLARSITTRRRGGPGRWRPSPIALRLRRRRDRFARHARR